MAYLDEIAENSNTWTGPSPMDSIDRTRSNTITSSGSVFKLREDDNMSAKISMLTKEIEALKMKGSKNVVLLLERTQWTYVKSIMRSTILQMNVQHFHHS